MTCSFEACGRRTVGQGLCFPHYMQRRRGRELKPVRVVPRREPIADVFWNMVSKGEGCWEWQGERSGPGYGRYGSTHDGRLYMHRYSYEMHFGRIPPGMFVCHRCDNPPCVRPEHLFIGTPGDNSRDCTAKGRNRPRRGEAHPDAKLTEWDIIDIRTLRAFGATVRDLGRAYSFDFSAIAKIARGERWRHV